MGFVEHKSDQGRCVVFLFSFVCHKNDLFFYFSERSTSMVLEKMILGGILLFLNLVISLELCFKNYPNVWPRGKFSKFQEHPMVDVKKKKQNIYYKLLFVYAL